MKKKLSPEYPELIHRWEIDHPSTFVADLEWFVATMQKNIFKRIQAPPIIITSKSSFGYDIRESMILFEPTVLYTELREKVLNMPGYMVSPTKWAKFSTDSPR